MRQPSGCASGALAILGRAGVGNPPAKGDELSVQ
jgi:hypothetical protein